MTLKIVWFFSICLCTFCSFAQHHLVTLIPTNTATHTAVQSGGWFDVNTWDTGTIPDHAAIVVIPENIAVTYDGSSEAHLFAIRVDGEFTCTSTSTSKIIFDTFIGTHTSKVKFHANEINAGNIEVLISPFPIEAHKNGTSGFVQIWNTDALNHFSDNAPTYEVTYNYGPDRRFNTYQQALAGNTSITEASRTQIDDGNGVLGRYGWDLDQLTLGIITMGELEIIGQQKAVMSKLAQDAPRSQKQLVLAAEPTGWKVGDEIIVSRSGNRLDASNATETAIISDISANTITTQSNLKKNHFGRTEDDLHCYVGNLIRNIIFRSTETDMVTKRAHLMAMHNPTNVQIRNAHFLDMGRTDKSRLLDDMVWDKWLEPVVFNSKISPLGQECVELVNNPVGDITNMRGRYSIHLHKMGTTATTPLAYVTGNVVQGNPGWGITHHDSHAIVSDNVVYDVVGAAIVSESGSEIGFWDDNLVVEVNKGHNTDAYDASLFFDDYLFLGEGLGMKGRAVVCRNNVIVDANRGVGIVNFNAVKTNMVRVDPEALATVRPHLEIDQFPLSQNGYSKEGDGIMPVEVALIMENTTTINCGTALRSIERDMGVNHESRSIFDGFKAWGTTFGVHITYQADYSFKDLFISGKNENSRGIYLWKHAHNHTFEKVKMVDLEYAISVSKLVEGGTGLKTRNNGFTPWIFIDLETENINHFYQIEPENSNSTIEYLEHPDNPIFLTSDQLPSTRPITFTVNESADLEIDLAEGDLQFKIDGAITDRVGTYKFGIKQAEAQGTLRLDYPERIYEFASTTKLEEFLQKNGVYKDEDDNDQLYFIINEYVVDRLTFQPKSFPIRIKINNAPNTGVYASPQVEDANQLRPQPQLLSRNGTATQSSTATNLMFKDATLDPNASRAIDGNNSGRLNVNYYDGDNLMLPVGSSAITKQEAEPWWDLDLGESKIIEYIDVWGAQDMHGENMETTVDYFNNFYVLISDNPFNDANLTSARSMASAEYFFGDNTKRVLSLNDLNINGQYIRIQAVGSMTRLGIAEVDVIGRAFSGEADCNNVINGLAYIDNCGNCVQGDTQQKPCELDCNNEWGGTAFIDNCGTCVGGSTGHVEAVEIPCNGVDDDCNPNTFDTPPSDVNLHFVNENIPSGYYRALETITAEDLSGIEMGEHVDFEAGESITLRSGFTVANGATFFAQVTPYEACTNLESITEKHQITSSEMHEKILLEIPITHTTTLQAYPNPFVQSTRIEFYLPQPTFISLEILNTKGQVIQAIVDNKNYQKGISTIDFNSTSKLAGLYYIVLKTEREVLTQKVVVLD